MPPSEDLPPSRLSVAWNVARELQCSYRKYTPDGWDQEIDRCQIDLIKAAVEDLDSEIRLQRVFLADLKSNNGRAWWLAHHSANLSEADGIHERPGQAALRDQFLKECEDAERKVAKSEDLLVTLNKRAEIMMPMDCISGSGPRIFIEPKVVELPGSPNVTNGLISGGGAGFLLSLLLTLILLQNCELRAKEGGT